MAAHSLPSMGRYPGVMHHVPVEIREPDDLLTWLCTLPALRRARLARALAHTDTTRALREVGDEAVYELTREASWADVAERLGVGTASVHKAVARHRNQPRPRKWPSGDDG